MPIRIMNTEREIEIGNHLWTCDITYTETPFQQPKTRNGEVLDAGCPADLNITDIIVTEVAVFHGDECVRTIQPLKNGDQLGRFLMDKFDISALEEEIMADVG